ncbi:MAG: DAK2 domain-containing protein, partial [Deinococcus sp.]|nr:DAK2 domain-containing protein [Deinococcus sp.]
DAEGRLIAGVLGGIRWLAAYREYVNSLNVFPVPDGDTGSNMYLTLSGLERELLRGVKPLWPSLAELFKRATLLGARGNSGVILSQFVRGFCDGLVEAGLGASGVIRALHTAAEAAYAAVARPVEGTILTVATALARGASGGRSTTVLRNALIAGSEALERTPELLPQLKAAGVVDAGGQGLLCLIEGALAALEDRPIKPPPPPLAGIELASDESDYGYCTEFLVMNPTIDASTLRPQVEAYGDCCLVVGSAGLIKGHVHTDRPREVLDLVQRYGTLDKSKVEDMTLQHNEYLLFQERLLSGTGLVAVASGAGVARTFRSLGATVVHGGQTQNPAVEDLLRAVEADPHPEVVLLPNNPNILLAAQQVQRLARKPVVVIPTSTLGQGLGAALALDRGRDAASQAQKLQAAAREVSTLEVTWATRDAVVEGQPVAKGQALALLDNRLGSVGHSPEELVRQLATAREPEVLTIFYGEEVEDEAAQALAGQLQAQLPETEIQVIRGGQALYPYIVTLE